MISFLETGLTPNIALGFGLQVQAANGLPVIDTVTAGQAYIIVQPVN